jgi:triacylglycerol lipase
MHGREWWCAAAALAVVLGGGGCSGEAATSGDGGASASDGDGGATGVPGDVPDAAPVDPDPASTTIVLLVPGTTITGDWFDVMADRLRADGFTPIVYEPPDLLTDGLALGAERIGAVVDQVLTETGASRLHIVAECNGGVATRYWLQALGGSTKVDQVVTFVSAHHGTWLSPIGEWVTGMQSLTDIVPGSPFLTTLDALPWPPGLQFTSIYSCWDELMLPYDTSVVDGATNVLFCDHTIGHFDGFWDPLVYERIRLTLQGQGASAPTEY